ncbi:MAG: peptidoglycan DD-metalloendopeptidase family protein [Caldilineaceae bacterium]|nr:peptidoglycan DD-metalloendopeptidase family protein [Caldilineaceae bacterium]
MLKSKEHVEQRQFNYHTFHRPNGAPALDREVIVSSVSSSLSEFSPTPSPNQINPSSEGAAEVALEDGSAGLVDTAGGAIENLSSGIRGFLREQVAPIRLASHLAVLVVAAIVILIRQVDAPNWEFPLGTLPAAEAPLAEGTAADALLARRNPIAEVGNALQRAVLPFTRSTDEPAAASPSIQGAEQEPVVSAAPSRIDRIQIYKVLPADNLQKIAARYDLRPETILWANPKLESNPDLLWPGQELIIPPVDGVMHVVRTGDTLSTLAVKYKVGVEEIVAFPLNNLESANSPINSGKQLIIPNGTKPYVARQVAMYRGPVPASAVRGSGNFDWPVSGHLTQQFWHGHRAIDVGARAGSPIVAADSGYVIKASHGWNGGYGSMVMVDHGNGFVSLYAHMNMVYVRQGENVAKGEHIGTVGNTGRSTGPHLHFEIRQNGAARNPNYFLP